MKVLLFAGTTEGRVAAENLIKEGADLTVCTATQYGADLLPEGCDVRPGRLSEDGIFDLIASEGFEQVVDATHPYAVEVTENITAACERAGVRYERIERAGSADIEDERVLYFDSLEEAAAYLELTEGNIFSAIGIKGLGTLTGIKDCESRVFARIIPDVRNLETANALGFTGRHVICMQGPFGEDMNRATLKELDIKYLLTKESGKPGGFMEKVRAALDLGVTVLVIRRPEEIEAEKTGTGFTTGTCAALAAKGAAFMAVSRHMTDCASLVLPGGEEAAARLLEPRLLENGACCGVKKEPNSDIDVTVNLTIYAKVTMLSENEIRIEGGEGVGLVTRPGLSVRVGERAINPAPRRMIEEAVRDAFYELGYEGGAQVLIYVPGGEEVAEKTFNPKLGIEGGISILGTTGIVRPMSRRAFIEAMEAHMNVIRAGGDDILITPGSIGEKLAEQELKTSPERILQCSNYFGEALDMAADKGFKKIFVAGALGKMVKVAGGIMETHSKTADGRFEVMGVHAAMAGADPGTVIKVMNCISTDAALEVLSKTDVYDKTLESVARAVLLRCRERCKADIVTGAAVFSGMYGLLCKI